MSATLRDSTSSLGYIVTTDSEEINYACIQSTMSLWTLPLRIEKYRKGKLLQLVKMHNIILSYKKRCYQFFDFSWQNFIHKNSSSKFFYNIISTIVFSVEIIGEIKNGNLIFQNYKSHSIFHHYKRKSVQPVTNK